MRIFILFYVFFISISGFKAQPSFNRAYHNSSELAAPFVLNINGNCFYLSKYKDNDFQSDQLFLYKYGNDSVFKFRKPVLPSQNVEVKDAFVTNDKAIILIYNDVYCTILPQQINSYLVKIDTNGNQIFQIAVNRLFRSNTAGNAYYVYFIDSFKKGCQNSDSSYSIFTDSVMFNYNAQGQFISKKQMNTDGITAVMALPNNQILMHAQKGNWHGLKQITVNGSAVNTVSVQPLLKKLSYYNGNQLMALSNDGNLYKISPNYALIANTNYPVNAGIIDYVCDAGKLYSYKTTTANTYAYFVCDTAFNAILSTGLSVKSMTPIAMCKSAQKLFLLANHQSDYQNPLSTNYFASISSFDRNIAPVYLCDISLSNVVVDTSYSTVDYVQKDYTGLTLHLRLKFFVKNNSNQVIERFKLNSGINNFKSFCGTDDYFQQWFTGLNIMPGDSVQLTSNLINRAVTLSNSGNSNPGIPQKHYVFITVPNNEVDNDQSNNEISFFENFHSLGIKPTNLFQEQISIYPNPVNTALKIESAFEVKSIRLTDHMGRIIREESSNSKEIVLDTQELPNGMYFICVETVQGLMIKKIIKE